MKNAGREHLDAVVVVWISRVSAARDSLPFLESCLDLRDQERAARFHFPEDRARFVMGRALVRKGLGRYLHQAPETIEITYTHRGRPVLARDETVQFNISHARDLVAVAFTAGARVGIDVEYAQSDSEILELAQRIFSEKDLQTFQALPHDEKLPAFFRAWTRKEAYLKARGEGIAEKLGQISVSFGAEESPTLTDARDDLAARIWRLHPLPVPADYAGSLACDDAEKPVECHFVCFDKGDVIPDPSS